MNDGMLDFLEKEMYKTTKPAEAPQKEDQVKVPTNQTTTTLLPDFIPLIAVTGDWHLFYRQYNLAQRITDIYDACDQIVDLVNQLQIPLVVHTGDVFHRNVLRPLALQQAIQLLSKLDADMLCIRGNHDGSSIAAQNKDTLLNNLTEVGLAHYVEEGIVQYTLANHIFRFYCVSYCGKNLAPRLKQLVETDTNTGDAIRVLVIHAITEGMDVTDYAIDIERSALEPYGFDLILTGHNHTKWHDPLLNILNPGSPETIDIRGAGLERGIWLIGFKEGVLQTHFCPIHPRPFQDLHIDVGRVPLTKCMKKVLEFVEQNDAQGTIVRLTIKGTLTDARVWEVPKNTVKKAFKKVFYVTDIINDLQDLVTQITNEKKPVVVDERSAFRMVFQSQFQGSALENLVDLCLAARDELVSKKTGRHDAVKNRLVEYCRSHNR